MDGKRKVSRMEEGTCRPDYTHLCSLSVVFRRIPVAEQFLRTCEVSLCRTVQVKH